MNKEVQAVMLVLLGTAVTRISLTDIYLRYVKSTLQPFLLATGIILLLLGLWAVVDLVRDSRRKTAEAQVDIGAEEHDGHGHTHMRIAWLLLLPVLAILLIAPPALGAYSAEREQSTVLAPTVAFDPLPPGQPVNVLLSDYAVRAVWGGESTLEGRTFEFEAFVTPVPAGKLPTDLPTGSTASWWLTRLALTCCAADATATKILAVGTRDLPANTWVRVTGHWIPGGGTENDRAIPWLKVDSLRQIPQPTNPYE